MNSITIFDALADLPDDIMADGRDDTPPQEREALGECPLSSSGNSSMRRDLPIENRGNNNDRGIPHLAKPGTRIMNISLEAERATKLLAALRKHILGGGGLVIGYIAAAEMIGLDGDYCRHLGQVVSRIDRACFDAGLPMLTLHWVRSPDGNINGEAFNGSVTGVSKLWISFNQEILDTAANFQWSAADFDLVQSSLDKLPKVGAKTLWTALETKITQKGTPFIRHNLHRRLRQVEAQTKTP